MAGELEWPDGILPSTFNWYLNSNGASFTSPWNGQTQTVRYPGSAWVAEMTLEDMDDIEARYLEVMLVQLDGMAGRIKLRDFGRQPAEVLGVPLVKGATQSGTSLITDGWTPNSLVLSFGQYITVNDELKLVTSNITSDATGQAVITFGPQLRNSPADNSTIEVAMPYGIFRLDANKNGVRRKPGIANDFSFNFVEAF